MAFGPHTTSLGRSMQTYNFRRHDFEEIDNPINMEGNNDYKLFRCKLAGRYGVYIFQTKCTDPSMRRTLYVGQGGVAEKTGSQREIINRLSQQYQVAGKTLTGQTFYKNWLQRKELSNSDEEVCRFLSQFERWRLTTITTDQKPAIPLIPAVEATFIYILRPKYNKPYPSKTDIQNAGNLDQALCATFASLGTDFKFVVR